MKSELWESMEGSDAISKRGAWCEEEKVLCGHFLKSETNGKDLKFEAANFAWRVLGI